MASIGIRGVNTNPGTFVDCPLNPIIAHHEDLEPPERCRELAGGIYEAAILAVNDLEEMAVPKEPQFGPRNSAVEPTCALFIPRHPILHSYYF